MYHGDSLRIEAACMQHFCEHLELRVDAILGQVTGNDDMVCPSAPSILEGCDDSLDACFGMQRKPSAEKSQALPSQTSPAVMIALDQVQVGDMRQYSHGASLMPPGYGRVSKA
jgi:hypothetical protein